MRFKNILLRGVAAVAIAIGAKAALPTFKTTSATGTAAAPSTAVFLSDPNSQIRLVSVNWQSDTNNARLEFTTGNGAYNQTLTNLLTSSVTNQINSTNGLVPNAVVLLEHNGTAYLSTVSSFGQSTNAGQAGGTNIVLAAGGWGVVPSAGDNVYQMSSTNYLFVGATTNAQNGEAIYVGNYGRPVIARVVPALVTNAIPATTAHYDAAGN